MTSLLINIISVASFVRSALAFGRFSFVSVSFYRAHQLILVNRIQSCTCSLCCCFGCTIFAMPMGCNQNSHPNDHHHVFRSRIEFSLTQFNAAVQMKWLSNGTDFISVPFKFCFNCLHLAFSPNQKSKRENLSMTHIAFIGSCVNLFVEPKLTS